MRCAASGSSDDAFEAFLAANPLPASGTDSSQLLLPPPPGAAVARELRVTHGKAAHALLRGASEPLYACEGGGFACANERWAIFAPQALPPHAGESAEGFAARLIEDADAEAGRAYGLALVTAEAVCVGAFAGEERLYSKITTAYTRRRKQGRAQMHFSRSNAGGGGGRSVGARLRARETVRLFADGAKALESAVGVLPQNAKLFWAGDSRALNALLDAVGKRKASNPSAVPPKGDARWRRAAGVTVRRPRQVDLDHVATLLRSARRVEYAAADVLLSPRRS